ncbi:MAG: O-antigen ligase family protein [Thermoleophilia bacterium]
MKKFCADRFASPAARLAQRLKAGLDGAVPAAAGADVKLLESTLAGDTPFLWARKKKRKPAPAPKPVEKKKPRKAAAPGGPPSRNRQKSLAERVEKGIGSWYARAGLDDYSGKEWARLGMILGGIASVLLLYSFYAGGYFVIQRGWGELIILYLLIIGVLFGLPLAGRMTRLGIATTAVFGAYSLWILVSVTWSLTPANSLIEFARAALYLGGFVLVYLFLSRREWMAWLGHLFVTIAFIVAVASLLHDKIYPPARFDFDARLSWPLTYWNTVAMMMVMAFPIGLRVISRRETSPLIRALYGGALFMMLTVLFFTFSRAGLGLLAVALGIYLLFAIDRLRALLQTGVAVLWTGAVIAGCYMFAPAMMILCNYNQKTCPAGPTPDVRASQGHILGIITLFLFAGAMASQLLVWWLDRRVSLSAALARKIGISLGIAGAAVVLAAGGFVVVKEGGPVAMVRKEVDSFSSTQINEQTTNASQRLLSTETQRPQEYKVSMETFAAHPLTGTGPATWDLAWLAKRPAFTTNGTVREIPIKNGHSIFFDALAEVGIIGAGLLAGFIVLFFVNSIRDLRFLGRSRHRELYGAFFAACTVLILHSFMDWDWQMPIIYLSFFFFAGGLLRYGVISRRMKGAGVGEEDETGAAGTRKGGTLRRLLDWKWPLVAGCLLVTLLTIALMVTESGIENDGHLIQVVNQYENQNDRNGAEVQFLSLEKSAARAHEFDPLDAQPLRDEAVANEGEGIYLANTGQQKLGQQKIDKALGLLNQALDLEPNNYKIYADMGRIYLETKQIDKAAGAVRKARQLDPLESQVLGNMEIQIRKAGGNLGY